MPNSKVHAGSLKRWLPEAAAVVTLLAVIAPLLPSGMRESDQAAVLSGAYDIAFRGGSPFDAHFYHYDKLFGSYLLAAGAQAVLPALDPVTSTNFVQFVLWLIATALLMRRSAARPGFARALLLATTLSTVWVLNVPFFSPAAVSAYTLVAAFATSARGRAGTTVEAALAFAATALRADAVLCLPFLVWSKAPRTRPAALLASQRTIVIAAAGAAALVLGHVWHAGRDIFGNPPRIIPKIMLAFTTFGLGPAAFTFGLVATALLWAAARRGRSRASWYLLGVVGFILPAAYYAPQLLSPRYLLLTVTITLCALATRRVASLLVLMTPKRARGPVAVLALALAVVPLGVGLQLPSIASPRLTVARATTYPSADGHWPMGAVAGFAYAARENSTLLIDHNQGIYESARVVKFRPCNGHVPVLHTPMATYLEFALEITGLPMKFVDRVGEDGCAYAYADLRSMTHEWATPGEIDRSPMQLPPMRVVSTVVTNQPIVLVGQEDGTLLRRELGALRDRFAGREFEVLFRRDETVPVRPGSHYRLLAPARFSADLTCAGRSQRLPVDVDGGFFTAVAGTDRSDCWIQIPGRSDVVVARTVLPAYMTLR